MNFKKKKLKTFFLNHKNNSSNKSSCILNYNDSINFHNRIQFNYFNKSFKNIKSKKILKNPLTKHENEDKSNLIQNDSFSFSDSNNSKFNILSNNQIITLNSIINKFKKNQSAINLFLNKDKRLELNSLSNMTNKSLYFLLNEEEMENKNKKYTNLNNEYKTLNKENNSFSISSKMVDLFNNRTINILNCPESSLKMFGQNKTQFTSDLLNYLDIKIDYSKDILDKLKKKYNEAVEVYENRKNIKIKKAYKNEKAFYKLKNEENTKARNSLYKKILFINKRDKRKSINLTKRNSFISNPRSNRFSLINNKSPQKLNLDDTETDNNTDNYLDIWRLKHYLSKKKIFSSKSEEKVNKAHEKYEIFRQKKFKKNAEKFSELINELISSNYKLKLNRHLDERSKKIKIIYNDLIKKKKIQKFNDNINNIEADELKNDYNKLRNQIYKCEDEYYRVSIINKNKNNLSFLKPYLKMTTIKKFLNKGISNFGIP